MPIGYSYKSAIETWSFSGSKTELKAEPESNHILFVKRVRFAMSTDAAVSSGKLHLKHSGAQDNSPEMDLEIADPSDLLHHATFHEKIEFPSGTTIHYGYIEFPVPVRCRNGTGQSFSVIDDDSDAWTFTAGSIDWSIDGWQIPESEYDESG